MFEKIEIGPIRIWSYGLMIMTGYFMALLLSLKRGRKRGLDEDIIWGIFFCAVVGGIVGSKVLFYIVEWRAILANPRILLDFAHGHVVYGGIIFGVLFAFLYCRKKKTEFAPYFDLVMPGVALAQGFGRIGCFLAGCCYGRVTDRWYGVTFMHSTQAPNGLSLIPTQLISSAGDFLNCAILLYFAGKERKNGQVAGAYLILYGIGRFLVEFLRGDARGSVGMLSTSQFISIGAVVVGAVLFFGAEKRQSGNFKTLHN